MRADPRIKMVQTAILGIHEQEQRDTIADILQGEGYVVEQAKSAAEILQRVSQRKYDVVVMDLNFGHAASVDCTEGVQIYRQVQRDVEAGVTRFVGFSGRVDTVRSAQQQGIPAYGKPLDLSVILGQ